MQIQVGIIAYKDKQGNYEKSKPLYMEETSELVKAQNILFQEFITTLIKQLNI